MPNRLENGVELIRCEGDKRSFEAIIRVDSCYYLLWHSHDYGKDDTLITPMDCRNGFGECRLLKAHGYNYHFIAKFEVERYVCFLIRCSDGRVYFRSDGKRFEQVSNVDIFTI